MEAMVFCAAVRLLGEEIRVMCEGQITLSYGVSFQGWVSAAGGGVFCPTHLTLQDAVLCVTCSLLCRSLICASVYR